MDATGNCKWYIERVSDSTFSNPASTFRRAIYICGQNYFEPFTALELESSESIEDGAVCFEHNYGMVLSIVCSFIVIQVMRHM